MSPILLSQVPRCDCCGLPIALRSGDYCPRCGYPVAVTKEEGFLEESIRDLQRVATYGGAQATVASLLQRYQTRYGFLRQQRYANPVSKDAPAVDQPQATVIPQPSIHEANRPFEKSSPAKTTNPAQTDNENASQATPQAALLTNVAQQTTPPQAQNMFSFRSFFADQTINIVSSLGAFLILIGSLSFVATTNDLFLSFLVIFLVHALFAAVGLIFSRFSSFRFIARVYTTIFALLVPLVGFSGYRLVAGHFIQLSAPTVVTIAALYATLVYAFLAVSQQFKLFGYLSATALVLADCAFAYSFLLNYWWWPVLLMPFAFIALFSLRPNVQASLLHGNGAILREPIRVLMYSCIVALGIGLLYSYLYIYAASLNIFGTVNVEARFVGAISLLLLLVWTSAYIWTTKRFAALAFLPYQFVAVVAAFAYVYNWRAVEFGLLFTAVAVFYHVGTLVGRQTIQRVANLRTHIEVIALVLVALVPLLVAPTLPWQLMLTATMQHPSQGYGDSETSLALLALLISCAVSISMTLTHTGFQRLPAASQTSWRWLLLLSALLFIWAYSVAILILRLPLMYTFLALTLVILAAAVALRRFVSAAWSNPLDVVVICIAAFTLLLSVLGQSRDTNLALLLLFATLYYAVMFYQRRAEWLFISFLFALLSFIPLVWNPRLELLLGVVLPIAAVLIARARQPFSFQFGGGPNVSRVSPFGWEWPLLFFGVLCAITVTVQDALVPVSTMQYWLGIPFSVALELIGLAFVWYIVAVLAQRKWWLIVAVGFAIASLLMPSNSFAVLLYLPFVMALLALAISQFTERTWAIPLYIVALVAAVKMGFLGYSGGQAATAAFALLGFAILLYILGVIEDSLLFLWLAPCFALWSVYNAAALGDLYRSLFVALAAATLGVAVNSLASASRFFAMKNGTMLRYSLPFYVTALAAAVLTGLYGMLDGSNYPFTTAIPDALFLYALVAYVVLVIERKPLWLWLVAAFAIWGMFFAIPLNINTSLSGGVPIWFTAYYLTGIALSTGVLGMLTGRLVQMRSVATEAFTWSWPWYLVSLLTIVVTVLWNYSAGDELARVLAFSSIFAFIALTLGITLAERRPALLTVPIALALWLIVQTHWQLWQQMLASGILFFLVFASSSAWRMWLNSKHATLYIVLGFVGQIVVLLAIMLQGGLATHAGALGQTGVVVLLLLAIQLFWHGWFQPMKQHWALYSAGLVIALAIPWELSLMHQTRIELLTLTPATYLIVIAPFLSRDERIAGNHRIGQICSILGSALLLLPTLWSSFSDANIGPTLMLAIEAFILLLLGVATRVRFFVLSGAALVVIGAMHALFLPTLGLSPSLALTIMGVTLLVLATGLSLARHRVQAVWMRLE